MILTLLFFLLQLSTQRMDVLDTQVARTSRAQEDNSTSLTSYLVKAAQNDEEKAYVIYSWIAQNIRYDVRALRRGIRSNKNEAVLEKRIAVCEGYATLFDIMARKAGLISKIIEGRARGTSKMDSYNGHAWNAVQIGSKWFLVDATWGSGFINSDTDKFSAKYNRFYFFTEPSRLVTTHLPDDPNWQLLESPITETDVKYLIKGTAEYYDWNIKPLTHLNAEIESKGFERIALKVPNDVYLICNLTDSKERPIKETRTFVMRRDDEVDIWVSTPKKGEYTLSVYGKKDRKQESYPFLFSYQINSKNSSNVIFPKTFESYVVQPFNLINPKPVQLTSRDSVLFDMESSAYKKMMIVSDGTQIELVKEEQRFFKKAKLNRGKLLIVGSVKGDLNYEVLMEFEVQ